MRTGKSRIGPGGVKRAGQSGYVVFWLALVTIVLLGFAGLVFDTGTVEFYQRRAQTAADAGAIGGLQEILHGGTGTVRDAAAGDVTSNGFTDGVAGARVTVNHPPESGPHVGNTHYVEVIVRKTVPTTFMRLFHFNSTTVSARAVGSATDSMYCIVALNLHIPSAMDVWGNSTVNTPSCGVMVNSDNVTGLTIGNSSCITAAEIDVAGNYTSGGCAPVPTPNPDAAQLFDPLSYLNAPAVGTCDYHNYQVNKAETLNPGVYCGGIKFVSNGYVANLNPGTYILLGGGLQASGGQTIHGDGITFYNTGSPAYPFGPLKINGNTTLQLKAPTSGPFEGIIIFQDRTQNSTANDVLGTNDSYIDGLIYMQKGGLTFTGNSSTDGYLNIVADTIKFSGNSRFNNNYSTLENGAPLRMAGLVE